MKKIIIVTTLFCAAISCFAKSNYKPHHGKKLPVISIVSESKNNDFVTKPKAQVVIDNGLFWGWIKQSDLDNKSIILPEYEDCTITVTNDEGEIELQDEEAQVKVRGNWTTSYDKKPLRIKFSNKHSMLNLNNNKEYKNWVLLASYKDWSFMRDYTAFYFNKLTSSNYSSDIRLVDVNINGEYWGVYLLAEQQEAKSGRIEVSEVEKKYKGTDIGYILEYDGYAINEAETERLSIDYTMGNSNNFKLLDINGKKVTTYKNDYTIKSDINDIKQKQFIEKYMNNLWKLCYEATYNNVFYQFDEEYNLNLITDPKMDAYKCVSKVIDIQSLIDTYIICEIACDPDLYWSSFYMDIDFNKDSSHLLKFEAPWDFDSAFGNKRHCANGQGVYAGAIQMDVDWNDSGCGNPWLMVFINCDWFQKLIKEKWKTIKKDKIKEKLIENIDYTINNKFYQDSFFRNQRKWNNIGNPWIFGEELNSKSGKCQTQKEAAVYLKNWIDTRFKALDKIWK